MKLIVQFDTKVFDIPAESNSDISAGSLSVCSDIAVSKVKACANKLVYDKICDLRSVCLTFEKPLVMSTAARNHVYRYYR